jgi:hypothetical protein
MLPISYVSIPVAIDAGLGIAAGVFWAIVLIGPVFILIALGGYIKRREAIQV